MQYIYGLFTEIYSQLIPFGSNLRSNYNTGINSNRINTVLLMASNSILDTCRYKILSIFIISVYKKAYINCNL